MSATALSLLVFVLWTMALALSYPLIRTGLVLTGRRRADDFPADRPHEGSELYRRLWRAHLNAVENLPLVAAVLLVAIATGNTGLTDGLAPWIAGLRVAQSSVHIAAVNHWAVQVRAVFWMGQLALLAVAILRLWTA